MEAINAYLVRVTAAALLCAIAGRLAFSGLTGAVIRTVCGVFLALVVVAPWKDLQLTGLTDITSDIRLDADTAVAEGENSAQEAMAELISEQVRAYILDKAADLGLELEVDVELSAETVPMPVAVTLRGAASPYAKAALQDDIRDSLGIGKEAQTWIS